MTKLLICLIPLFHQAPALQAETYSISSLSGPWKGDGLMDGIREPLQLNISVNTHPFLFRGALRSATRTMCAVSANDPSLESARRFSLPCNSTEPSGARPRLDFEFGGKDRFRVVWRTKASVISASLTRLAQDIQRRFEGDWVSDWPSVGNCVLHIYQNNLSRETMPQEFQKDFDPDHLVAFLDQPRDGIFGIAVGLQYSDDKPEFSFAFQDIRSEVFEGRIDPAHQEIVGKWPGHPWCSRLSRVSEVQKLYQNGAAHK